MATKAKKKMDDKHNPFCHWKFSSGSPSPSDRILFATKTPPTHGYDGYQFAPGKASPRMYGQMWCEAVKGTLMENYRAEAKAPKPDSDPTSSKYYKGSTLQFQSACSQLKPVQEGNSTATSRYTYKSWSRYDCEQTTLGSHFM
jgi:hypothetical protein